MTNAAEIYASRPWLALYAQGMAGDIEFAARDCLTVFKSAVARAPDGVALIYFDGRLTYAEFDRKSDALAAALASRGFVPGDRLAIYMQNMPQFVIATLAAWKAGGCAVTINPMNRQRELTLQFRDSTPRALVCLDTLYHEVIATLPEGSSLPPIVLTASARDLQTRDDERVLPKREAVASGVEDLLAVIATHEGAPAPALPPPRPEDIAFMVYTSGTTGLPKGSMNTHGNVAFNAQTIAKWDGLEDGAPLLGLAPLFHVTGIVALIVRSWAMASPLILCYRFEPGVALDALVEHQPIYTVSAITAFIALIHAKGATREHFASLRHIVSGGAPIPPSVVEEFRQKTGLYIHNGYGLTETCAGVIAVPRGREAPVDPIAARWPSARPAATSKSGWPTSMARRRPSGEAGEIVVTGPMVAPGYWNKPEETAASMRPDGFRTGDVGFMDEKGWFYLVDRKKDVIIASGFKVWPREVEDVLYAHPAVREAAVIGVPDAYRGETVKAVVCLKPDAETSIDDLSNWCKTRLATYKFPREIEIVDELPKTTTGKILRRMLR